MSYQTMAALFLLVLAGYIVFALARKKKDLAVANFPRLVSDWDGREYFTFYARFSRLGVGENRWLAMPIRNQKERAALAEIGDGDEITFVIEKNILFLPVPYFGQLPSSATDYAYLQVGRVSKWRSAAEGEKKPD